MIRNRENWKRYSFPIYVLLSKATYNYEALDELNSDPEISGFASTALGVLLKKKAVCEGISKTFKLLLNAVDVKCICVSGAVNRQDSETRSLHQWNIVKIENESYHFDFTWAMGGDVDGRLSYDYFGLNDSQIKRDHFDFKNVPVCSGRKYNYFELNHMVVRNQVELEEYLKARASQIPADIYVMLDFRCDFQAVVKDAQDIVMKAARRMKTSFILSTSHRIRQQIIRIYLGAAN